MVDAGLGFGSSSFGSGSGGAALSRSGVLNEDGVFSFSLPQANRYRLINCTFDDDPADVPSAPLPRTDFDNTTTFSVYSAAGAVHEGRAVTVLYQPK